MECSTSFQFYRDCMHVLHSSTSAGVSAVLLVLPTDMRDLQRWTVIGRGMRGLYRALV